MEGIKGRRMRASSIVICLISLLVIIGLASCGDKAVTQEISNGVGEKIEIPQPPKLISEVSPPEVILELGSLLEEYQPQVAIASPQLDQLLPDNTVTVGFQVKDLPIYKNSQFNLGPHLQVILDNEPATSIYDLNQPLEFTDLSPGTHSLRVFAVTPWNESFKNEGAYAQTTFHILTKTDDNNPDPSLPLLTYNIPQDSYGAEPILLDFYLTNAPLHFIAQQDPDDQITDWRIRCTINGESFVLDRWQPIYLKGFKPGKNWVRIEYLDEKGEPVKNFFNSTTRIITYEPKGKDPLSQIVRGELKLADVRGIVDPNYTPPQPVTPSPSPTPEVTAEPALEKEPVPEVEPDKPVETEQEAKQPEQPVEKSEAQPSQPEVIDTPTVEPRTTVPPEAIQTPVVEPTATPQPEALESPSVESITPPQPQPEVVETPSVESTTIPQPETLETPVVEPTTPTQPEVKQPTIERLGKYFKRSPTERVMS
ncbi:MAG: hypothetical protein VKL59_13155 [Nostocaceae cyanobacterium]|nr:hypothetical protein [Nostocaceae cyanobacterium]